MTSSDLPSNFPRTDEAVSGGIKILVVDDSVDDVFFVRMALHKAFVGCDISSCEDGVLALAYLNAGSKNGLPDLIVLDINMPKLNGFQVLKILKENPATSHIPVVMHTGSSFDDDRRKALDLGAMDFVTKEAHCARLVEKIREFEIAHSGAPHTR
jgi:CheY-like chemotaxis protein